MNKSLNTTFSLIVFAICCHSIIYGQEKTDSLRKSSINLFIDCPSCDEAHIKKEINFVNYVRETQDAHVYVLITYQITGSGGREYSFLFKGQKNFHGENDTLVLTTEKNNTSSEIRNLQINMLKIGLLKYLAQTQLAKHFDVGYRNSLISPDETADKWNNWIFSLSLNGFIDGEKSYKNNYLWSNLSASRITEKFKITNRFTGSYENSTFGEGEDEYNNEQFSYRFNHLTVWAINQHWSVGEVFYYRSSLYSNYKNSLSFYPAVEYNFLPFSESTRKLLVLNYRIGIKYNQYFDTTIYNKTNEYLAQHSLGFSYTVKEKWGSIYTSLVGSNYLHDFKFNNVSLYSRVNLRIFKGISLNFSIGASLIHDQLNLAKGEINTGDLLLRRQELETSYQYWGSVGINIQFGSIFNNTVNERFGGSDSNTIYISFD